MISPKPSAVAPIVVNNPRGVMVPPVPSWGVTLVRPQRDRRLGERSARLWVSRSLTVEGRQENWEFSGKWLRSDWENRHSAHAAYSARCQRAAYSPGVACSAVTWCDWEVDKTGVARGRRTVKTAPCPGVLARVTSPPWAATIEATMESPSPVPPRFRVRP